MKKKWIIVVQLASQEWPNLNSALYSYAGLITWNKGSTPVPSTEWLRRWANLGVITTTELEPPTVKLAQP